MPSPGCRDTVTAGPGGVIDEATTARHRDETVKAFQAADRLRLYGLLSMLGGAVLFVAVVGAVIIGWIDWVDGVVWASLALLVAVAPGARFYADATRTTVNAASVERSLGLDEDLFAPTLARRKRVRIAGAVGVVVALIAVVGIGAYSMDNADTRTPISYGDDDDDDDDDDGDDDGAGDDAGENEGDDDDGPQQSEQGESEESDDD